MVKLYAQVDEQPKRLYMARDLAVPPQVGGQVYLLPSGQTFQVTSIEAVDTADPLLQTLYIGTLTLQNVQWGGGAPNHL